VNNANTDLKLALTEVSASSAGGSPFLIGYGATFFITGLLSFFISDQSTALLAMFQGGIALPVAFWLERRMGKGRMAADNPLRSLSALMAFSQVLALPALIVAYSLNPRSIPVVLAALGGVHFLPYAWLHRTRIYAILAVSVSIGAFLLQLILQSAAFSVILLFVAAVYWISAPFVYQSAARLASAMVDNL